MTKKRRMSFFPLQHNIIILLLFTQTLTSALLFRPSVTLMPTAQILVALIAVLASLDSLVMAKLVKVCLWRERGAGRGGGGRGQAPINTQGDVKFALTANGIALKFILSY